MLHHATGLVLLHEYAVVLAISPARDKGAVGPQRQHRR
jgi:hypothetical protein